MVQAFATSDVGKVREINEDYFSISYPNENVQVFLLADGMGGYDGGEIASQLAVTTAKNYIVTNFEKTEKDRDSLLELVRSATQYANMVVYDKAKERGNEELRQMGTTLDVCLIYQNKIYFSHVGDSRIYRLRKGFFRRLTKDDSYVQQLVDEGKITKDEAINHPDRNMLVKALGVAPYVEVEAADKGYMKDDVILMCSDGLTNMVSEEEIAQIILDNPSDATGMLIQRANDMGGKDNITAIIIR